MSDGADGNKIHARQCDVADGLEIHSTARLRQRASSDDLDRRAQLPVAHVVQQDDVRPRIGCLRRLLQRVGLNLDFQLGKLFSGARHSRGNGIGLFTLQCD